MGAVLAMALPVYAAPPGLPGTPETDLTRPGPAELNSSHPDGLGAAVLSAQRTSSLPGSKPAGNRERARSYDAFNPELLTPAIEAAIGMPLKQYLVPEIVKLRVTSTQSGWSLTVKATDLRGAEHDFIRNREIFIATDNGLKVLSQSQTVVGSGAAGVSTVEIILTLITDGTHAAGTHTGQIQITAISPWGVEYPLIVVPFTVTVGCRVSCTVKGHKMYFHFGDLRAHPSLTGTITGTLSSDALTHMTLSVTTGRIDQIPLNKRLPDGKTPSNVWIPLQWKFREGTCGTFRAPDTQSCNGRDATWTVNGTPGTVDYHLECIVQPSSTQTPGDYSMPLELTIVPVL